MRSNDRMRQRGVAVGLVATALTGLTVGGGAGSATAATCSEVQVVVARGTGEPGGAWSKYHLGTVVGNPVYNAIDAALTRTTTAYRVDYPATTNQPMSVQAGNRDLVDHVVAQAASCPDQKFVLVGYSQGANVVANSLGISSEGAKVGGPIVATLPASVQPRIAALLLFGNPIRGIGKAITGPYAERTYDVCNDDDPVCDPDGTNWNVHLRYTRFADEAAAFAVDRV
ncbi:cutinase family protein [Nocardia cyriacigeorgica]|nr:cutinase family protein [Nocardia cyriacigeorgica]